MTVKTEWRVWLALVRTKVESRKQAKKNARRN